MIVTVCKYIGSFYGSVAVWADPVTAQSRLAIGGGAQIDARSDDVCGGKIGALAARDVALEDGSADVRGASNDPARWPATLPVQTIMLTYGEASSSVAASLVARATPGARQATGSLPGAL